MTSLVGTTGVDTATIVSLDSNVFVGANTGDDVVATDLLAGSLVAESFEVRMGGGDDTFTTTGADTIVGSFISGDGLTLANDGDDDINVGDVFNSEIVGRGGDDDITVDSLFGSTINGNTGIDIIAVTANSSDSFVYGGQGDDIITSAGAQLAMTYNGNKGADSIVLGGAAFTAGSVYGGQGIDFLDADAVVVADDEAGVFMSGDIGNDIVIGSDGEDTINGGAGDDHLDAGTGADTIDGGAGDDTIDGGTGGDVITTGAGNDVVLLTLGDSVLDADDEGFDTITDFSANTAVGAEDINGDIIDLTTTAFAGYTFEGIFDASGDGLGVDLAAIVGVLGEGAVEGVTLRAGAYAGNYLVIGGGLADDNVIKMDTSIVALTDAAFTGA